MDRKPQFRGNGIRHATINGRRFHLRLLDPTKDNFLWVDGASPPLILDPTAAEFVALIIDGMWKFQCGEGNESEAVIQYVVDEMYKRHGKLLALPGKSVTRARIRADLDRIFGTLMAIAEGECPAEMTMGPKEIEYAKWVAPARMDCAITYRCGHNCGKCLVGNSVTRELPTQDWLRIYETLWKIGVSHLVFTGGDPPMREDLVTLVNEADEFVTGLITTGTMLTPDFAKKLIAASLDYVQITIESLKPETHDQMTGTPGSHLLTLQGIQNALNAGIPVVTNTTLTRINAQEFLETLRYLREMGVKNVACNTLICSGRGTAYKQENGLSDKELASILLLACGTATKLGLNLQWYSPTCYTLGVNPVALNLGIKSCSAAAYNMLIQPDGSVLPCQSWPNPVGNILTDKWESIWNHPTCLQLRAKALKNPECNGCQFETSCSGGCPLDKSLRRQS